MDRQTIISIQVLLQSTYSVFSHSQGYHKKVCLPREWKLATVQYAMSVQLATKEILNVTLSSKFPQYS